MSEVLGRGNAAGLMGSCRWVACGVGCSCLAGLKHIMLAGAGMCTDEYSPPWWRWEDSLRTVPPPRMPKRGT